MIEEFYDAAVEGEIDELRRMLAKDPTLVRATDKWGFTALHGVAGEEHLVVADYLLDQGADPNAGNNSGITPLHLAAYPAMVELLIRRGAEIDIRAIDGSTPLIVQAEEPESLEVMKALLRLGADAQAKTKGGLTALDIARSREEDDKVRFLERGDSAPARKWWKLW